MKSQTTIISELRGCTSPFSGNLPICNESVFVMVFVPSNGLVSMWMQIFRCVVHGQVFGFGFPAAAQRLVKENQIGRHGAVALHERVLRLIQRTLGVQHIDEVGRPLA